MPPLPFIIAAILLLIAFAFTCTFPAQAGRPTAGKGTQAPSGGGDRPVSLVNSPDKWALWSTGTHLRGGLSNTASGTIATVGGGYGNTASGYAATVPGGYYNTASGDYSFAAGRRAKAVHDGSFVLTDATNADFQSSWPNQFRARFSGGFTFVVDPDVQYWVRFRKQSSTLIQTSTGASFTLGGRWQDASDRALKENFTPLDPEAILEKVGRLPITTWNYKAESPRIKHIGPVAQDFYALFGMGTDDKHIAPGDANGIALAAIQGLYRRNQALEERMKALQEENAVLRQENATLREQLADLAARLAALEREVKGK